MRKVIMALLAMVVMGTAHTQEIKKVALVTMYVNDEVVTDFKGGIIEDVKKILKLDKSFSTKDELEKYHKLIFGEIQDELPFELLPESEVINTPFYKEHEVLGEMADNMGHIAPEGYRVIGKLPKKEKVAFIEGLGNADALMFIRLNFSLERNTMALNSGMGKAKGSATLVMIVFDKEGKAIIRQVSKGESDGTVKIVTNAVPKKDIEKVPVLLSEAADVLLQDVKNDLPKKIQKMYKKLQ